MQTLFLLHTKSARHGICMRMYAFVIACVCVVWCGVYGVLTVITTLPHTFIMMLCGRNAVACSVQCTVDTVVAEATLAGSVFRNLGWNTKIQ